MCISRKFHLLWAFGVVETGHRPGIIHTIFYTYPRAIWQIRSSMHRIYVLCTFLLGIYFCSLSLFLLMVQHCRMVSFHPLSVSRDLRPFPVSQSVCIQYVFAYKCTRLQMDSFNFMLTLFHTRYFHQPILHFDGRRLGRLLSLQLIQHQLKLLCFLQLVVAAGLFITLVLCCFTARWLSRSSVS